METTSLVLATLLLAGLSSIVLADDAKKKTRDEKPKASPGWVAIEEDWLYPFLYEFSNALHNASEHYRAKEEKSASAEIDKAITWLQFAQAHANKSTAEEISTARSNLIDFSTALKSGRPVLAKNLDASFANESAALGKHHYFESDKALREGDLKGAGMMHPFQQVGCHSVEGTVK